MWAMEDPFVIIEVPPAYVAVRHMSHVSPGRITRYKFVVETDVIILRHLLPIRTLSGPHMICVLWHD
jgi:hypothetical protein